MGNLIDRHCAALTSDTPPLDGAAAEKLARQLSSRWQLQSSHLAGDFEFGNYYETQAFVNAVAWIAHSEDHHPDITFGYKRCRIELTTHDVGGLSDNDFIVAAKIDHLLT